MSRKRSHTKAFALSDNSENGIYLLPGCYYNPELEFTMCEDCCSDTDTFIMEERSYLEGFPGDGLYIADAYGNIYYNSGINYMISEEIVCFSDARMEGDDLSDRDSECNTKKSRSNTSSDEEETSKHPAPKQLPGYIVEEPPDEDTKTHSK